MEDYIAQARRHREVCQDFLAANPKQHSCTILRSKDMSYKPEVFVDNEWAQNNCAFATKEEAEASAFDLMSRWMLVQDYRAVESDQPVNYKLDMKTKEMSPVDTAPLELNLES